MPRMGGPELVEKLKQKGNAFAAIFMSGYTEAAALENAKSPSPHAAGPWQCTCTRIQ